jgi:hypothetical protein
MATTHNHHVLKTCIPPSIVESSHEFSPLLSAVFQKSDRMSSSAFVIVSGQASGPLATAFAPAGHKTPLIEEAHVGGTCSNEGYAPTKTMVASTRVTYLATRGKDYSIELEKPFKMNIETVRKRKRNLVGVGVCKSPRRAAFLVSRQHLVDAKYRIFAIEPPIVYGILFFLLRSV